MKTRTMNYGAMFVALLMILVLSTKAYACACCSNGGEWSQRANSVDEFHRTQMDMITFAPGAKIYMGAGDDDVKGMSSTSEKYSLSLMRQGRRWTLSFKDEQGKTGTLSFTIPANMVSYTVDPRGGENYAGGAGPTLYHEWRFAGAVTGTGIFKKGMIGRTRFHLVLQGTSNACIDAAGFHNWNLQVSGPRADYSFYGSLKTNGNAPENATGQSRETETTSGDNKTVLKVMLALVEAWNNTTAHELTSSMA